MQGKQYIPPAIISVHGIRTRAEWQNIFTLKLEGLETKHIPYNYGYYNIFKFLRSSLNEKMVDKFYEVYSTIISNKDNNLDTEIHRKRPSVIAHSFGTYIVAYAMIKYPDVKFDKFITCGSILPRDFAWMTLFMRDQVNYVQNEYGLLDFWTKIVGMYVRRAGNSGTYGFTAFSNHLSQIRLDRFTHSDYFKGQHITKYWIPFLFKEPCNFIVKHGHDLESLEHFMDLLDDAGTDIDEICFGHMTNYEEVPRELSLKWKNINPDIYTYIIDQSSNKIAGYLNAMPVLDEVFDKIANGQLLDHEIQDEYVLPFLKNQNLKIYFLTIAVNPDARKANEGLIFRALEKLINGFVNKLVHYYLHHNIKVTEFVAVGWTSEGRKLCELLGMKKTGADKYDNPVYTIDIEKDKTNFQFDSVKSLVALYRTNAHK